MPTKESPHGSHEMGPNGAPCQVCWVWADDDNIANECAGPAGEQERQESEPAWKALN